jgi:hypothetical protein
MPFDPTKPLDFKTNPATLSEWLEFGIIHQTNCLYVKHAKPPPTETSTKIEIPKSKNNQQLSFF